VRVFQWFRGELTSRLARRKRATADAQQRESRVLRSAGLAISLTLVAVAVAGCGGSSSLPGSYTTNVSGSPVQIFDGQWTLTLKKGGSYTVEHAVVGNLHLKLSPGPGSHYTDSELVITNKPPGGCGGALATGTYRLKHTGDTVTLTTIGDGCFVRPPVLAHSFKRTTAPQ
jgi:hypothetical protein